MEDPINPITASVKAAIPRTMIWPPQQWDVTDEKERAEAVAWATSFVEAVLYDEVVA